MIIASTSTVFGSGYLNYLLPVLQVHFKNVNTVTFIPYAMPGGLCYDAYTSIVAQAFSKINMGVKGIHEYKNPKEAILNAEAIFTGGGNTFELVNQLYKHDLLNNLKLSIERGIPYVGTSAGSNICGVDMKNTNDMPIVEPPSFTALGILPFQLNPHYTNYQMPGHNGETRAQRLLEFTMVDPLTPAIGIQEGSALWRQGDKLHLIGNETAYLFHGKQQEVELTANSDLSHYL